MEGHGVTPRPSPYRAAEMVNRCKVVGKVLIPTYFSVQSFDGRGQKARPWPKTTPLRRGGNDQVLVQIIKPNFTDMLFMVHRGCPTTRARY